MIENGIEPAKYLDINDNPKLLKWLTNLRSAFPKVQTYTKILDPASVNANTTSEQTFTVQGLTMTDIVIVNKPSHTTGIGIVGCRVSAVNTLAITYMNCTALLIDPPSEDYFIKSVRR